MATVWVVAATCPPRGRLHLDPAPLPYSWRLGNLDNHTGWLHRWLSMGGFMRVAMIIVRVLMIAVRVRLIVVRVPVATGRVHCINTTKWNGPTGKEKSMSGQILVKLFARVLFSVGLSFTSSFIRDTYPFTSTIQSGKKQLLFNSSFLFLFFPSFFFSSSSLQQDHPAVVLCILLFLLFFSLLSSFSAGGFHSTSMVLLWF